MAQEFNRNATARWLLLFKASAWRKKTGPLEPLLSVVGLNQASPTRLFILESYTNKGRCIFHDLGDKTTDI